MTTRATRTAAVRRRAARWQRLGEQVVVLDVEAQRAHSLDGVVATVFELADGERSTADLIAATRDAMDDDVAVVDVEHAVIALRDAGLLDGVDGSEMFGAIGRRRLLRLGAGAALGGAALVTIGLPTPAAALSTGGPAPEFLNTSGYLLFSGDVPGDGSSTPIIQSLNFTFTGTGTPPDVGYITINPNVHEVPPIVWSLPVDTPIPLADYVGMLDDPDYSYWMAATSVRVWFYDTAADPDLFLGQAYFTSPS